MTAKGMKGNVKLLILVIKRKNKKFVMEIIKKHHPDAFISIEQVQSVAGGNFPITKRNRSELYRKLKI